MTDRVQLNLRLDGRRDLLEAIKEVATAEGLSVNAWVIKTLESATSPAPELVPQPVAQNSSNPDTETLLDNTLDIILDNKLAAKFAEIEERLGKVERLSDNENESLRQQELELENQRLQNVLGNLEQELSDRDADKKLSSGVETFPEAAELYNQFKAQNKKSKTTLVDIEAVLDVLEELKHKNLQSSLDKSAEKADR